MKDIEVNKREKRLSYKKCLKEKLELKYGVGNPYGRRSAPISDNYEYERGMKINTEVN